VPFLSVDAGQLTHSQIGVQDSQSCWHHLFPRRRRRTVDPAAHSPYRNVPWSWSKLGSCHPHHIAHPAPVYTRAIILATLRTPGPLAPTLNTESRERHLALYNASGAAGRTGSRHVSAHVTLTCSCWIRDHRAHQSYRVDRRGERCRYFPSAHCKSRS
jgi:hypothetical protein